MSGGVGKVVEVAIQFVEGVCPEAVVRGDCVGADEGLQCASGQQLPLPCDVGRTVLDFPGGPSLEGRRQRFPFISGAWEVLGCEHRCRSGGKQLMVAQGELYPSELALRVLKHVDVLWVALSQCIVSHYLGRE